MHTIDKMDEKLEVHDMFQNLTESERIARGMTPYPSNYLIIEAKRDIDGIRYSVKKGDLRIIRFGYSSPMFVPHVVIQARLGQTLDWGGASVFTDAYRVLFDGRKPFPSLIEERLTSGVFGSALSKKENSPCN